MISDIYFSPFFQNLPTEGVEIKSIDCNPPFPYEKFIMYS